MNPSTILQQDPFPSWPVFSKEAIEAASRVLASGKVNQWTGTECTQFETEFARLLGIRYAIAVANGTLALEGALEGLGLNGPEVEVRSFSQS
jgi:dTDP-4-amino-4,6-dideoxygalactose transaminase